MRKSIKMNIDDDKANYKTRHHVIANPSGYEPGDRVWLRNPKTPIEQSKKLIKPWVGPYYIITKFNNDTYSIRECISNKPYGSMCTAKDLGHVMTEEINGIQNKTYLGGGHKRTLARGIYQTSVMSLHPWSLVMLTLMLNRKRVTMIIN